MNVSRTERCGAQLANPLSPCSRFLAFIISVWCSRAVNGSFQSPTAISIFLEYAASFSFVLRFPRTSFSDIEYPSRARVTRVINLSIWTLTIIVNQVRFLLLLFLTVVNTADVLWCISDVYYRSSARSSTSSPWYNVHLCYNISIS